MQKPEVDFLAWIARGTLAGVLPGDSKEHVLDTLGKPVGWAADSSLGEVGFVESNIWGYGVWTLYFDGSVLDAVTCATCKLNEHDWHFDVKVEDTSILRAEVEVETALRSLGIFAKSLPKVYRLLDHASGEIVERRRRLSAHTLLAGNGLRTRFLFEDGGQSVKVVGHPFDIRRQVLSYKRLYSLGRFELLNSVNTQRENGA